MKSDEAKRLTMAHGGKQPQLSGRLMQLITEACARGEFSIPVEGVKNESDEIWLNKNGYRLTYVSSSRLNIVRISWD